MSPVPLPRRLFAEFLGSAFLAATVVGSGIAAAQLSPGDTREMREQRLHLGLVHDEHGTVVGLLTMEDILEELVGEIEDEFDVDGEEHFRERDGRLHVDGQAPVRALAERVGWELDEHHESTVGGYLSEQLGRVPEVGETVACHGWKAEILAVEETRSAHGRPRRYEHLLILLRMRL